jgi:tetratricopeptide (TPR) repeat protein
LLTVVALAIAPLATLGRPAADPYTYSHHAVSTSIARAQSAFDRGLTLVYAYQPGEAEQSFRQAARLDPTLAMAWWGVALALGPDINTAPDPARTATAAAAIARARLLAARRATAAERDYIEALAARYSGEATPDFDALALRYRDRMRALWRSYPNDPDAAALFAEAIMDLHPWRLWTPDGAPVDGTVELVSVIESGLKAHPDHIGLMHLYIHALEASNEPGRALAAARRLAATPVEPAAAHLVHMPAHTFLRVGDWQAAVEANEHAVHHAMDFRLSKDPGIERACGHCLDFLTYAYAMQGNFAAARHAAQESQAIAGDPSNVIAVLARFRRFDELLALPEPPADPKPDARDPHVVRALWHYGRGLARLGTGDRDGAAAELAGVRSEAALAPPAPVFPSDRPDLAHAYGNLETAIGAAVLGIAEHLLAGRLALARGEADRAITEFRAAVEVQEHAQYTEPPLWLYPARETLAAALLRSGDAAEAELVLRECLKRTPHDPRAILGLQQALTAAGRRADAAGLAAELAAAQARADEPLSFEAL